MRFPEDKATDRAIDRIDEYIKPAQLTLVNAATIVPECIRWLWPGWLAAGKLHICAGPPGAGKTTVALNLAATITRGGKWPDDFQASPGHIVIWSGEDGAADTLVPRLQVAGAKLDRVSIVADVTEANERRQFDPATDIDLLRSSITSLPERPRLLIVDPIVSAISGDSHKNAEVRRALQPLVDLAADIGCAVLGITHYSKGTRGRDPVERVTGSIAFGAVARIVWAMARLPEEHEKAPGRILVRAKSNIGIDDGGFLYDLAQQPLPGNPEINASRVIWQEAIEGSARDWLAQAETVTDADERTERDEAADFLRDFLGDGQKPRKDVIKAGRVAGFTEITLKRARERAGVASVRSGYGAGAIWKLRSGSFGSPHPEQVSGDLNGDGGLNAVNKGLQQAPSHHSDHSDHQIVTGEADPNGDAEPIPVDQLAACQAMADKLNDQHGQQYTGEDVYREVEPENRAWLTMHPQWAALGYRQLLQRERDG